jgi:tetratricopeptide (TPR) repeat protein
VNINKAIQLAFEHHRSGNLQQAESLYRKILKRQPRNSEILHMLGVLYSDSRNYDAAIQYIKKALRFDPNNSYAYYNLGNTYRNKGELDESIRNFQKAIELNPKFIDAYYNLGIALQDNKQINEAIVCYQEALQLNPSLFYVFYNLGNAFKYKGQFDKAIDCYQKVLKLNPSFIPAYINLTSTFRDNGQLDDAVTICQKALVINPSSLETYVNLGTALQDKGQLDEALDCYRKVLNVDSNFAEAHWNMSLVLLTLGNYMEGWKEHEWRWKLKDYIKCSISKPLWDGYDIQGLTILLYDEQGYGDSIQFIRYVSLVAQRGARIIVSCKKELKTLFQNIEEIDKVIAYGNQLPDFDIYCPLLNLPLVFNTTLENIPAKTPYINVEPELARKWRNKIQLDNSKLKVGLVWATGEGELQKIKSFPLIIFSKFAKLSDVTFYSLQKGVAAEQAKNPPKGMKLFDYMGEVNDFADTAAIIESLDLVISADTAVAHLAGALGKPTWIMIPIVPIWQWMLHREDSPWYPTVKLFRQPSSGNWESVIANVQNNLLNLLVKN